MTPDSSFLISCYLEKERWGGGSLLLSANNLFPVGQKPMKGQKSHLACNSLFHWFLAKKQMNVSCDSVPQTENFCNPQHSKLTEGRLNQALATIKKMLIKQPNKTKQNSNPEQEI